MDEQQAYDVKVLVEKLKAKGLDLAEDAAKSVISETFDWLLESAKASKTPIDDIAVPFLPHLKDLALKAADKLDGQVG